MVSQIGFDYGKAAFHGGCGEWFGKSVPRLETLGTVIHSPKQRRSHPEHWNF